ncbi:alpha-tocopherol transfer protein-like [Haemaphysalis longicornis]
MAVQPLMFNAAIEDGKDMPRASWTEEMEQDLTAQNSLEELRKRLKGEPDLEAPTESADLMRFLRLHKYDVDASLALLRKYCAIRKSAPSLFDGLREPEKFRELASDIMTVLPRRNLHGRRVLFGRFGKWNPSKVSHEQVLQTLVLCLERASWDPAAQTAGLCTVSDFEGWSMGNIRFVNMRATKGLRSILSELHAGSTRRSPRHSGAGCFGRDVRACETFHEGRHAENDSPSWKKRAPAS